MPSDSEQTVTPAAPDPQFERLLRFLKADRGFDFTGYKRTSLMRRVGQQMQAVGAKSYEDYQDYLELHPEEFTRLFNTILINVTSFFRDPEAWATLSDEILPRLVREKPDDVLRLWSAGSASGEEAYSLAIALAEIIGPEELRDRVKIYATDVDEDALDFARHATYPQRRLSGVSPERLETYFERVNGCYAFRKDLRRSVIFGRNDLVQDAPISHIDLLACRNTLMYFDAEQQGRILRRLHYALNPHGIFFLGKTEMLSSHGDLFRPVDLKQRFYEKLPVGARRDGDATAGDGSPVSAARDAEADLAVRLRLEALNTGPLAHVVVDYEGRLAFFNQRATALFNLSQRDVGRPFQDLEMSYRPLELRSYLAQTIEERRPLRARGVEWIGAGGEQLHFDIHVVPLLEQARTLGTSVFFTDVTSFRQLQDELEYASRQLETAYEALQSTNEELETTNEELQSTVEELETTNDELQSTNEELETMNEELQSLNDELQSSNEELRNRTEEIAKLNTFTESILSSLRRAVAVTDRDLRVLIWNEQSEEFWGLRRDEAVGRQLFALDIGLPVEQLRPLVRRVLADQIAPTGDETTLEAVNRRGRPTNVRVVVRPLRASDGAVSGVIVVTEQLETTG